MSARLVVLGAGRLAIVLLSLTAASLAVHAETSLSLDEMIDAEMGVLKIIINDYEYIPVPLQENGHAGPQPFDQEPPLAQADLTAVATP